MYEKIVEGAALQGVAAIFTAARKAFEGIEESCTDTQKLNISRALSQLEKEQHAVMQRFGAALMGRKDEKASEASSASRDTGTDEQVEARKDFGKAIVDGLSRVNTQALEEGLQAVQGLVQVFKTLKPPRR